MPRPRKAASGGNSLIASAAVITRDTVVRPAGDGVEGWQRDAWHFYDNIGEFRFGCDWRSAMCSRAKLTIVEVDGEEETTLDDGPEVEALSYLFGGDAGQGQMLGTLALHYDVPGESYIVGETVNAEYGPDDEADRWGIYSNEEITRDRQGVWTLDRGDGNKRALDDTALVIRLWRSHPRRWVEATSPARAVLPILRELEGLTKHVAATIDSRLAGAGLLLVPSEMTFTPPPGVELNPEQQAQMTSANLLLETLTQAMIAAIRDRGSAAAVAPIVAQAPGALLEHVKHITFSTPFDDKTQSLRDEGIRRLALGLDMPPEVLLGVGGVNHWSAWQIDESALKTSIEPTLEALTAGLTDRWLYPAVEALVGKAGVNTNRRIGYDVTELRLRADRTPLAQWMHDKLMISDEALLREGGFDAGDIPDEQEFVRRVLMDVAMSRTSQGHDVAAAALKVFVPDLVVQAPLAPVDEQQQPAIPEKPGVAPGVPDAPMEQPPAPPEGGGPPAPDPSPASSDAAVLAAAELLVTRAVERANNRLNNRRGRRVPIPIEQLDAALRGAWDQAPRTAAHLGITPAEFVAALDAYTRALLQTGEDHTPAVLAQTLTARRELGRG